MSKLLHPGQYWSQLLVSIQRLCSDECWIVMTSLHHGNGQQIMLLEL